MAIAISYPEPIEIPSGLGSLADFRAWALSDGFPERGRIEFIAGRIEVDLEPEEPICHSALKVEIIGVLAGRVRSGELGWVFAPRTRVSVPVADLSAEPDVVFLSNQTRSSGTARLVPKSGGGQGRYVEIEGPPDLVVEIVSDSSVVKDTRRLFEAYAAAGIREYWIADARGEQVRLAIHQLAQSRYQAARADTEGYQRSTVLSRAYRLDAIRDEQGDWEFDLREKAK